MNLTVQGTQEFLGKQIPVIEGGFGEGQRCILAKDIAEIHGMQVKHVNELIKKNIDEFEEGVDILEMLGVVTADTQLWIKLGISKDALNSLKGKEGKVYLLSESGYIALCMLMKTDKAREIRKKFRKEYFAMRTTLATQAEYIKMLEENLRLTKERNMLLEDNAILIMANDKLRKSNAEFELKNQELNERINTACQIPRKQLTKDIKVFLSEYTKNIIFGSVFKDELYGVYLHSRRGRREQPTRSQFEDIISNELGYKSDSEKWFDIVWK